MSDQSNKPVQEFRSAGNGTSVTAAIWRNETEQDGRTRINYSIRLKKRYYDRDAQSWQDSETFFPEDLPRLQLVAQKAYEFTSLNQRDPNAPAAPESAEHVVA